MINSDDTKEHRSRYLSYSSLGFQLLSFMIILGLVGYWIDKKTLWFGGKGLMIGLLLGVVLGMIYTIRGLMRLK
jgi:F0F1-type ATP synthase assembly protein I